MRKNSQSNGESGGDTRPDLSDDQHTRSERGNFSEKFRFYGEIFILAKGGAAELE
jgi:hypothetical protein